jgi:hypothetical protein
MDMTLTTLTSKIKQEGLRFSPIHEKMFKFIYENLRKSSKKSKNNNTNQNKRNFTTNLKSKYNPNVTYHYCGKKGHIVLDCKDKP